LGGVRDRVPVARRPHGAHAALLGHRVRVVGRAGKDRQAGVTEVADECLLPALLGVAGVLAHGAPATGAPTVRVGEDEVGAGGERSGTLRGAGPKPTGASRPGGGGVSSCRVGRGRARLYRSNWRSLRSTTSPTPSRRATGAIAPGSSTPSCRRRSSAFRRSADG